ncbi:MAG TPA: hypothetical protein VF981_07545 [Gemmatimonadaceae bacterium]
MRSAVHFLPIVTTICSLLFAIVLLRRWRLRGGTHHLWWAAGMLSYGAGTLTESLTTILGWQEGIFKVWYITGALLGAAPLAQGSAYLHVPRRVADTLAVLVVTTILIGGVCVWLSPVDLDQVETYRLSGRVFTWQWVRRFSPFVNLYAVLFLVGGAVRSAVKYARRSETRHRFIGNVFIAIGGILPGIGGTATRFGHVEVLYVTELMGLALLWIGFRYNVAGRVLSARDDAFPVPARAS